MYMDTYLGILYLCLYLAKYLVVYLLLQDILITDIKYIAIPKFTV